MAILIDKDDASSPSTTPALTPEASTSSGGSTVAPTTMIGESPNPPVLPRTMTMDEQLFHAVLHSPVELIEWLINEVSDVDVRDPQGYTALHRAVMANRDDAVETLMDNGADADAALPDGTTLLHRAVAVRNASTVERLLDNGADVDQLDAQGYSPAIRAVLNRDTATLAQLLANSADLDLVGPDGLTALYQAVLTGEKPCLKLLLDDGADADIVDANGVPLLHAAVRLHRFIRRICEQANDVDVTDQDGNSALHLGILSGLPLDGMVKLLDYVSQDTNARGETPLFLALLHRADLAVVKALIDDGPDLDQVDVEGLAPLHLAIAQGDEAVFRLLLENGADVDLVDVQGQTPLDQVRQRPQDALRDRMEQALIEQGAGRPTQSFSVTPDAPFQPAFEVGGRVSMDAGTATGPRGSASSPKVRRTFWQWLWNRPVGQKR